MLRLINRFKRNLLKEGKIKSFLFYTLGEVFLVVVGILIALQIDNWNEDRKEERELKEYLGTIANNLSQDLILADSLISRRITVRETSRKLMDAIILKQLDEIPLTVERNMMFRDFHFVPKKGGFESLISSGYIGKLKQSKLDSLLFEYYYIVQDLQREEGSFNGYIESMEASISATTSVNMALYKRYYGYNISSEEAINSNQEFLNHPAVMNALMRSANQNSILPRYKDLVNTGNLLIKEIEIQLK